MFTPPQTAPLQALVTRPLIQAIFAGKLPGGTHLVEEDLATQFQVSRAPIREALREIAGLGLIELRHNRGAVVAPFNPDSLRGIYRVRVALESEAMRLAAPQTSRAEAAACKEAFVQLLQDPNRDDAWSARAIERDEEFHELLATWAGVARLSLEIRRYYSLVHEIREVQGRRYEAQEEAIKQHIGILEALLEGHAEKAAEAMRKHILDAAERAVSALFPKSVPSVP